MNGEVWGILIILLISSAHLLHIQATLCLSFRPVEDIHRRRSSDQPDVFKSCVQNRAWRFGQGFVPGKVWKGPLLDETVLDRVTQENSSCSWTAGLFCLSQQCSKIQTQMQLIIHAMHSITCSFMWSGVSPLNHLLQRDWKSLELFVGRREMEHHNSVLVSWRITFLYMLKSKQNPRVSS